MGEDFNASDCSWKKMVIAKANNEWISTIKSEEHNADGAMDTTGFSLDDSQMPFGNVKREREDTSAEYSYQNMMHEPPDMMQEVDPLEYQCEVPKRRRRKPSAAKNETPEERAMRLAKMSAYAAQRLASETPQQRAMRLKRMSEYAAKRLAQETSEQRARRLARMSAYAAKRLAEESPEQRRARLARMSAYAARRQAIKKSTSPNTSDSFNSQGSVYSPQMNNITSNQS